MWDDHDFVNKLDPEAMGDAIFSKYTPTLALTYFRAAPAANAASPHLQQRAGCAALLAKVRARVSEWLDPEQLKAVMTFKPKVS